MLTEEQNIIQVKYMVRLALEFGHIHGIRQTSKHFQTISVYQSTLLEQHLGSCWSRTCDTYRATGFEQILPSAEMLSTVMYIHTIHML